MVISDQLSAIGDCVCTRGVSAEKGEERAQDDQIEHTALLRHAEGDVARIFGGAPPTRARAASQSPPR